MSSNNSMDIGPLLDAYQPAVVIIKAYTRWELGGNGARYTVAQAAAARARGCAVSFYIWLYDGIDGAAQVQSGLDTMRQAGGVPRMPFLDLESYTDGTSPGPEIIRAAVAEVERQGFSPAIYTGGWWLVGHYPGGAAAFTAEFGRLVGWLSQYDGIRTLESLKAPTGWPRENLKGKQYSGSPVDRSVFSADVFGI